MCTRHLFTERHLYFKVLGNVLSVFCFSYTMWFCEPSNCSFNRHTGWNVFSTSKAETQGAHTVGQKGISYTGTWEMCVWMRKKGMQKKRDGWRRWAARAGLLQKWYPEEQDSAHPCPSVSPLSFPIFHSGFHFFDMDFNNPRPMIPGRDSKGLHLSKHLFS